MLWLNLLCVMCDNWNKYVNVDSIHMTKEFIFSYVF